MFLYHAITSFCSRLSSPLLLRHLLYFIGLTCAIDYQYYQHKLVSFKCLVSKIVTLFCTAICWESIKLTRKAEIQIFDGKRTMY